MVDNSRKTEAAVEAHFQFLLWLIPAIEKFPRSQIKTLSLLNKAEVFVTLSISMSRYVPLCKMTQRSPTEVITNYTYPQHTPVYGEKIEWRIDYLA